MKAGSNLFLDTITKSTYRISVMLSLEFHRKANLLSSLLDPMGKHRTFVLLVL